MEKTRVWWRAFFVGLVYGCLLVCSLPAQAQPGASLSGQWTLNRPESEFPREIGFSIDGLMPPGGRSAGAAVRPSSGLDLAAMMRWRQSEEEARRRQVLTAEVRTPPQRLTITDTPDAVTFTDERGRSRTFYPHGREVAMLLDGIQGMATAMRDGDALVVQYKVEATRTLRYRFSRVAGPERLKVEVTFLEKGGGDAVTRVYDAARLGDLNFVARAPNPLPPVGIARPGLRLPTAEGATLDGADSADIPAGSPGAAGATGDGTPMGGADAALRGLRTVGLVVEGVGAAGAVCGLKQAALETALMKAFDGSGVSIRRNGDEDTYLYVNVTTDHDQTGLCVSRYDAGLYAMTTATLSHQKRPALVEAALLRKGGLVGTDTPEHAATVTKGLLEYVTTFLTQIKAANR